MANMRLMHTITLTIHLKSDTLMVICLEKGVTAWIVMLKS